MFRIDEIQAGIFRISTFDEQIGISVAGIMPPETAVHRVLDQRALREEPFTYDGMLFGRTAY